MSILKKSPSQKLENIFLYICKIWAQSDPNMREVTIRTGRPAEVSDTSTVTVPMLDIWTQSAKVVPTLEDEWTANLHFTFTVQADEENAKVLDARTAWLIEQIMLPSYVRPLVNFPLSSRPEPNFWLVDVYQSDEESMAEEIESIKYYRETVSFLAKFRNDNGQG